MLNINLPNMTDAEKINYIIDSLKVTAYAFAISLGDDRATKIYNIQAGRNGLSKEMANKILTTYPNINKNWLLGSEEKPLIHGEIPEIDTNVVSEPRTPYKNNCRDCEYKDREIDLLRNQVDQLTHEKENLEEWISELRNDKKVIEDSLNEIANSKIMIKK